MSILYILDEIAANNSKLAKIAILKREKQNKLLQKVLIAGLHPFINYYQKKIPEYTTGKHKHPLLSLSDAIDELQNELATRFITGNAAIENLQNILEWSSKEDAVVIERIVTHDFRAGFGESTVNKVWPGLIPTFEVCLSHKDISGIKYPAYAQTKMDGGRCHLFFNGKTATAWSRNGKELALHGVFNLAAEILMRRKETFDGEIVFYKDNKPLNRKTSNGLFNKAVKGTLTAGEAQDARFIAWDIVDFSSKIPYIQRFEELEKRVGGSFSTKISLCYTEIVKSATEAETFFAKMISRGEEGAILKNMNFFWVPKRTKDLGKMKAEEEADLLVVGWEEGTGKNKGKLGALVCETTLGLLSVNVGTGFSDEDRDKFTKKYSVGKIVTVRYNAIIDSKNKDTKSLFLPRFVGFRADKTTANSLEELK